MRSLVAVLALGLIAAVVAVPTNPQRIVGGSVTTIERYPTIVALLATRDLSQWWQSCGGIIINSRSVLTAAHCVFRDPVVRWRVRVGSTWANSGGAVHTSASFITHPNYDRNTLDNDVAIVRTSSAIAFGSNAQAALFAGTNYNLGDNQVVWAAGWGDITPSGPRSEQLRHVQVWTINQAVCQERYSAIPNAITANMLCSGWLDVGGRDQCAGDSGGPLYHNNVVVGVCSWGLSCADPLFPGVNARVSRYTDWLRQNA